MAEYTLRPYQQECVDIVNALPDGSKTICALATGLGKSVIFSRFDRRGGKVLILSHRDELVRQPEKYYEGSSYTIEKADEHADLGADIVSASVQSISRPNRLKRFTGIDWGVIIVDEAHHSAAETYKRVIHSLSTKLLVGMTATPQRGDSVRLDDIYDTICFSRDLLWGIRNGWLSDVKCRLIRASEVDISEVKVSMGDFNITELGKALDTEAYYQTIYDAYFRFAKDRHVLLYCLSVEACYEIQKRLRSGLPEDEQYKIQVVVGDTDPEERSQILREFMDEKVTCIVNCMVLTEGTDLPIADTILCARPTVNQTLYTQMVGRGTRLYDGKDYCLVLDIMPESKRSLCTVYTLCGMDIEVSGTTRKRVEDGALTDVSELALEMEKTADQIRSKLEIYAEEYDLFADAVREARETVAGAGVNLAAVIVEKEYGTGYSDTEPDLGILHYHRGIYADSRYIVSGGEGTEFFISEPDMLGNVDVTCRVSGSNGVNWYKTDSPVKIEKAVKAIELWLLRYRNDISHSFYWNRRVIERWKEQDASESQSNYIWNLAGRAGHKGAIAGSSKYEASVAISYLKELLDNEKKLKSMEKELSRLKKARSIREVTKEEKDGIQYKPFEDFMDDIAGEGAGQEPHGRTIETSFRFSLYTPEMIDQEPSEKQIAFACRLAQSIEGSGALFDCDVERIIREAKTSAVISGYIEILKAVEKEKTQWAGDAPVLEIEKYFTDIRERDLTRVFELEMEFQV